MTDLPRHNTYDVIIIGGAMIGSSIAWFTASNPGFDGSILVIERDPTYEFSSTAHTNSCIRQQFSTETNIRISQFGVEYLKNFRDQMGGDDRVPEIILQNFGYLYLSDTLGFAETLQSVQRLQASCGAGTRHLSPEQIAAAYPFYNLDGILCGNLNTVDEGYFDGATMFDWWRRKARERGVEYIANEVTAITRDGGRVTGVTLQSGETIACGQLVNTTGPRAACTAEMVGLSLPVEPRKRYTYVFSAEQPLDRPLPLTVDPSGVHVRSDGALYMAGSPPREDGPVDPDDFEADHDLWIDKVWPAIAHRIPQFEAIRLEQSWVGHYAYNTLDQNAVLGPHPEVHNFLFANGFSGHGFQQAPAVGRGIAEWLVHGEYRSLDLSEFGYGRIAAGRPITESAII